MEPQEIKGTCILGLVLNTEVSSLAGDYARTKPQKDISGLVSNTVYYAQNDGVKSSNLENIIQASGGILPKVNRNIGAPLCTFIKGYFAPDGVSAHFPLIKGPSKITNFSNDIGSWEYNPLPLVSPATIPATTSVLNTGMNSSSIRPPNNNNYLVIPSKYDTNYPQAKTVLTTWNIWEPVNMVGAGMTVGVATNQTFRYQPQWGILYPTTLTQEQQDQFCFITPSFGDGMGDAYIYCPSPNKVTTLKRMFPISCDLAYRYEDLGHKPQIYYPPEQSGVTQPIPQDIMSTGGANCGFQLHFQFPKQNINTNNSKTNVSNGIYVYWGSVTTTDPSKRIIETFYLQLTPGEAPMLYFVNPLTNLWDNYPLNNAPAFAINGGTSFSVYVHFVGPIMLIGFNASTANIDWFAFNPILLKSPILPNIHPEKFFPYIPPQSQIYLTFSNILVNFRYGPITFNNYDADGVPLWNKINQNLSTSEKYNCRLNTQFILPNRSKDDLAGTVINDNFHAHRVRNPSIDTVGINTNTSNQPTYYADWRKIIDTTAKTGYELNWEQISLKENIARNEILISGRVVWDTTIEGPLYLHVATPAVTPETPDDLLQSVFDVSEYLTGWRINYEYPDGDQNHGYMISSATVTLKDLPTTPEGRAILTLLEGNIFGLTLGAGIDDVNNYFQGVIRSVQTKYEKSGAETTLECSDLMSEIFDNSLCDSGQFIIDGLPYLVAVRDAIDLGRLKPWYVQEDNEEFLQYYADLNIGVPFFESLSGDDPYLFMYGKPISDIIMAILSHFVRVEYPAVLYWNPVDRKLKLDWRKKEENIDTLEFFGYTDADMLSFLPTDLHGVITDGGYTIYTDTSNIHAGLILSSSDVPSNQSIMSNPPPSNAYSKELFDELVNQIATGEISKNDLSYVGWKKIKYMDLQNDKNMQVRTYADLDNIYQVFVNNFVKVPYTTINFEVFVTQPLHPQGQFVIRTFSGDKTQNTDQTQNTDYYRYKKLQYMYTKKENKIIASIEGENFPPVLQIPNQSAA